MCMQNENTWKMIAELTDKTVLGTDGLSEKEPRRTSRAILINPDGLYAVMYAKKFDLHTLPGGGIEEGETAFSALEREIFEETGCTCDGIEPLGIVSENRFHADYTSLCYFFVVHTKTEKSDPHLTELELENGTILKWCTLEEAIHLIRDREHDTNQRKFLQARDVSALTTYCEQHRAPKRTIRGQIHTAYSLHDANIIAFEVLDDNLCLKPQSGMIRCSGVYDQVDGWVEFQNVQWDFCYAYVLDHNGNVGTFTGTKMMLKDFIKRFDSRGFSVIDEVYGYNQTKYWGYLSGNRTVKECIIEIYHEGDMVFVEA